MVLGARAKTVQQSLFENWAKLAFPRSLPCAAASKRKLCSRWCHSRKGTRMTMTTISSDLGQKMLSGRLESHEDCNMSGGIS